MRRFLVLLLLGLAVVSAGLPASAQSDDRTVEVVELSGPIDGRLVAFAVSAIQDAAERGTVEVVVLSVDSPGAVAPVDEFDDLVELVEDPPLPVVAWIGPAPTAAGGGALQLAAAAPLTAAASGVELATWSPVRAGSDDAGDLVAPPSGFEEGTVVEAPGPVVDLVQPSIRQLIQDLDGMQVETAGGPVTLSTVEAFTDEDGTEGVTVIETVIRQPGWWNGLLGLAVEPEAAFFFLVAGLVVAAFEFYAIGPGIAASVAAASLLLSAYGLAVLPVRWWALALTLAAVWVLSVSYQRGGVPALTGAGLVLLTVAGFSITDAAPQITPGALGVLGTVAAAGFFFLLAMPTVARSRFSTQTIGRDHLVGSTGTARADLDPDGVVEVGGARWRASSHREAGIREGDPVVVTGVDGLYLEVDRMAT